jgi:hypothetical protein
VRDMNKVGQNPIYMHRMFGDSTCPKYRIYTVYIYIHIYRIYTVYIYIYMVLANPRDETLRCFFVALVCVAP